MLRRFLTLFMALCTGIALYAQQPAPDKRTCGSPVPPASWDAWFNDLVSKQQQQALMAKESASSFTIPVIVHVIHSGQPENVYPNISVQQIQSQISILNADFAGNGYNVGNVPSAFSPVKASCSIVFSMAQLDPDGKSLQEAGIHRVDWRTLGMNCNPMRPLSSAAFQTFFDDSIKPVTIWDPTRYFNIWISDRRSSLDLLGYSTFPAQSNLSGVYNGLGSATNDGVWIWPKAFGNVGSIDANYNKGRTATHEIGHWLGLRHIWGDAGCGDDYCADTPPQQTSNFNCPTYPKLSCSNGPNGDMFMNFMDYCDDNCLVMFTWDQCQRMHTALNNAPFRKQLTASSLTVCNLPGEAPVAKFSAPDTACMNSDVGLVNETTGLPMPVWNWVITPSDGFTVRLPHATANPTLIFTSGGEYTVSLNTSSSEGSSSFTRVIYLEDCGFPVSLKEAERDAFSVGPNPSNGLLYVYADIAHAQPLRVRVGDLSGRTVLEQELSSAISTLDLSQLQNGVYSVQLVSGGSAAVRKVVLQH